MCEWRRRVRVDPRACFFPALSPPFLAKRRLPLPDLPAERTGHDGIECGTRRLSGGRAFGVAGLVTLAVLAVVIIIAVVIVVIAVAFVPAGLTMVFDVHL